MTVNTARLRFPEGKYFTEQITKDMIVLHFTAGSTATGAFQSWINQKIEIGTPFIVDKDGTIYEVFDPKYWAYHLGITGAKAQNHKHDKRSIPIEIVSLGPLKLKGDTLYSWPNNYQTKFGSVTDTGKYVKATYRGFDYYEAFTPAQKSSVVDLVKKLSSDFKIPLTLPPAEKREVYDLDFFNDWVGVASHQNFRPDKFDVGPAWDWSLLA